MGVFLCTRYPCAAGGCGAVVWDVSDLLLRPGHAIEGRTPAGLHRLCLSALLFLRRAGLTLHPTPYTRMQVGCWSSLHPTPCTRMQVGRRAPAGFHRVCMSALLLLCRTGLSLHTTPYSHIPYPLHRTPYTLHPTPYTLQPTPYTEHPTPYTLQPSPCTLNPEP